ncbi:unnamed protein product [Leptidea sinapis]|uniref:Uncharacterized protein n=1 Tax=Leptidea sinapis TaxID=189913 RepID=A0A5E4PYF5_9NEOP|nr:unnamed protein product [Leptidea sinapis]
MKSYVLLLALAAASAMPTKEDGVMEKFVSALRDCVETDTVLCLKEKAMKFTENLAVSKELNLVEGINFARTGSPRSARSYEPLPDDPKARELQVEDRIMDNVVDFLDNHVLQLRMPKSFTEDNSVEEEVFKAYLLGKVAFIAAAIGALKKLLDSKNSKSSGWSEPAHEEHGWESGGGGGWGRSQDAQSLAYANHIKQE